MKILIICVRYYPEQFSITNIAEQIALKGHNVTILTGKPNYGYGGIIPKYRKVAHEFINGVEVFRINNYARKKSTLSLIMEYLSYYFGFNSFLRKHKAKYDIVFSHVHSPILTVVSANKYCKKNKLKHFHYGLDLWPESLIATNTCNRNSILYKILFAISKNAYSKIDSIAFSSPSVEWYFNNVLKLPIKIKTIYQPSLSSNNQLTQNKYGDCITKLVYIGSITKFTGISMLAEAVNRIEEKDKLKIVVVGSGSEMPKLCETIKRLEIEKYFDVVGRLPVSETIKYYESADAVFIPLLDNSYTSHMIPQKVIETLKLGRPILGMISGDGRKILEESGGSIFCEESVEGIYNGINELMKLSIQQKKLMGTNNYAYYKSHPEFTLEYTCDAIISEMSKIIGENN